VTALPPAAGERIARTLDAARLRRGDREDVAAELAAHVEDGIASGRPIEDLLDAFGEPAAAGALIGRSVRRRRRAHGSVRRAATAFALTLVIAYATLFARLRLRVPERTFESPSAAVAAWSIAARGSERAAFETVLETMYSEGEDGRLTAAGLRAFQAWKGKSEPGLWSIVLEPAFFPNPARRGEVRREFERFLGLAEDASSPAFEIEKNALLSDRSRALRFVALQIPLDRLAAARAASRRTP
jgi:hypothetical protein